jgi:hypothetical protein
MVKYPPMDAERTPEQRVAARGNGSVLLLAGVT